MVDESDWGFPEGENCGKTTSTQKTVEMSVKHQSMGFQRRQTLVLGLPWHGPSVLQAYAQGKSGFGFQTQFWSRIQWNRSNCAMLCLKQPTHCITTVHYATVRYIIYIIIYIYIHIHTRTYNYTHIYESEHVIYHTTYNTYLTCLDVILRLVFAYYAILIILNLFLIANSSDQERRKEEGWSYRWL